MKRRYVTAAAIFAGAIPFLKEREDPDCKNMPCTIEPVATIPEQPHALDEPPNFDDPKEWIVIMTSPVTHIRHTPQNLEWAKERGLLFEDAL